MKCKYCGKNNEKDSIYCIICGNNLFSKSENVDYLKVYENIINNLCNNYQLNQIQKNRFINKLHEIDTKDDFYEVALKLIKKEKSYYDSFSDEEYRKIVLSSKTKILNSFNKKGLNFTEDLGKERISESVLENIQESVPIVVNEHGEFSRSLNTAMFGLIGMASTGGIKTEFIPITKQIPMVKSFEVDKINKLLIYVKEKGFYIKNKEYSQRLLIPFEEIYDIGFDNDLLYISTRQGTFSFIHAPDYYKNLLNNVFSQEMKYKNVNHILTSYYYKLTKDIKEELIIYFKQLISNSKVDSNDEFKKIQLLKEYANLKKQGIITEDEFKNKKTELLN